MQTEHEIPIVDTNNKQVGTAPISGSKVKLHLTDEDIKNIIQNQPTVIMGTE